MRNCTRCGASLGDFDAGGDGICANCEASSGFGSGSSTDVPCQRCGMYLPPYELRMWNSRLYCSYCIMDIQDEEKYGHQKPKPEEHGGVFPGGFPDEGGGNLPQGSKASSGTCERCGRQTDTLYSLSGRRVCSHCYSEGGAGSGAGGASILSQLITKAKEAFGMGPKILPKTGAQTQPAAWPANRGAPASPSAKFQPPAQTPHERVFSIRERSMVWKDEEKSASETGNANDGGATGSTGGNERRESAHGESACDVFSVKSRKMVEKKSDIESSSPISEGKHKEKKPSLKAKKFFFGMHPSGKGGKK